MQTREKTPSASENTQSTREKIRKYFRQVFEGPTLAAMVAFAILGGFLGAATNGGVGALIGIAIGAAAVAIFAMQIVLIWTRRNKTEPWHIVAGAVAILTLMLMGDITGLLLFMREENVAARSIGWLTKTLNTEEVMDNASQLAYFDATIDDVRASRWIIWAFIVLDSIVFVWAYGMVGLRILVSRQQRVKEHDEIPNVQRFLKWAIALLIAVLVIDWIENLAVGVLVEDTLATVSESAKAAAATDPPMQAPTGIPAGSLTPTFIWITTIMWWAKWISVGLIILLFLADRFTCKGYDTLRGHRFVWFTQNNDELVEAGRRIRPLLVTLVVLAALLFQPLQIDDLMLSLGDDRWKFIYATIATVWMGITFWSWTRHLLRHRRPEKLRDPADHWLILLGIVLAGIGWAIVRKFDWHWIVTFPGTAMAILGVAGFVVGDAVEQVQQPKNVELAGDRAPDQSERESKKDQGLLKRICNYLWAEDYRWVLIGGIGLLAFGLGGIIFRVEDSHRAWSLSLLLLGVALIVTTAVGVTWRAKNLKRTPQDVLSEPSTPPDASLLGDADDSEAADAILDSGEHPTESDSKQDPTDFLPAFVGAGAVLMVGTSMLSAAAAEAALASGSSGALWVTLVGAALVIVSGCVLGFKRVQVFGNPDDKNKALVSSQAMSEVSLVVSLVAALVLAIWVWSEPVETSRHVGALPLLLLLITFVGAASGQLIRWIDKMNAPRIFRQFAIDRFPVFVMIGVWLIVGQVFLDRSNHDVPEALPLAAVVEAPAGCESPTPSHPSMKQAWDSWLETNAVNTTIGDTRTNYPFIVLAASGGGIRAGWWSAAVMGELISEPGIACPSTRPTDYQGRQIFAASGISGGSVGLATHQAAVVGNAITIEGQQWVDDRLGIDHLSPPLAWFAYVELPQSMLGFPTKSDRAAIMEQSWQEPWGSDPGMTRGLHHTWRTHPQIPILALNGVSVDDGCRVVITVLDLNSDIESCDESDLSLIKSDAPPEGVLPQTYGLGSLMCDSHDMRLSTGALLSARFPLISPSGRLRTGWSADDKCSSTGAIEVVDGGYRDSNGAETAIDLWREIQPLVSKYNSNPANPVCIVPVFVQILDDFRLPAPPTESSFWAPLLSPLEAILAARGTQGNTGDRAIAAEAAFGIYRYEIQPGEVPPGAHPALGWSLSATTREKMGGALEDGALPSSGIPEFELAMNTLIGSPIDDLNDDSTCP